MKKTLLFGFLFTFDSILADVNTPHQCAPAPSQKCFTVIIDQQLNWNDAEKYCENNLPNGRLASVHNAFEGAVISGLLSFMTTDPWIGAFHMGRLPFRWSDYTKFEYTNWTPGQPTGGSCAQLCRSTATNDGVQCQQGKWRAADCSASISQFVCEYGNYTTSPPNPTDLSLWCYLTQTDKYNATAADCLDLHEQNPSLPSGVYKLSPPGIDPFNAYCDMETNGGGWTVIQRRVDGGLSFHDKSWGEYKYGFHDSNMDKNLWLGNENIYALSTKDFNVTLRIEMWGDRSPNSSVPDIYLWQEQPSFYIDSEDFLYTLHLDIFFTGNASMSKIYGIHYNIGMPFSTIDNSHDACNGCCNRDDVFGGWWLDYCSWSSLNGQYIPTKWRTENGFDWKVGKTVKYINPAQSRMMLRKVT